MQTAIDATAALDEVWQAALAVVEAGDLSDRLERIGHAAARHRSLREVIACRANDPTRQGVPEARTGLLVRQERWVGGRQGHAVEEWTVDVAVLRELRELERQVAIELGQWHPDGDDPDARVNVDVRVLLGDVEAARARVRAVRELTNGAG